MMTAVLSFLSGVWGKFSKYIIAAGVAIAGIAAVYFKGRSAGTAEQKEANRKQLDKIAAEGAEKTQQNMQGKIDAQDYVSKLPAGSAADELRKHWTRRSPDDNG